MQCLMQIQDTIHRLSVSDSVLPQSLEMQHINSNRKGVKLWQSKQNEKEDPENDDVDHQ